MHHRVSGENKNAPPAARLDKEARKRRKQDFLLRLKKRQIEMAVDIGSIIKFNAPGSNKIPKMAINGILNIPICVKSWKVDRSRFHDGNPDGLFVELEFEIISDGRVFRTTTGSGVIMSQLDEIDHAVPKVTEFNCIIRRSGKCYKMFPAVEDHAR